MISATQQKGNSIVDIRAFLSFFSNLNKRVQRMRLKRIHYAVSPRPVFYLEHEPPLMLLHKATDYSMDKASMNTALSAVYTSALNDDVRSLYSTYVRVDFPDGPKRVSIDCRNTQFIALNRSIEEFSNGYEPTLQCLIDLFVKDNGVFVDVGSNWGCHSFYLAARSGFKGKIHCIEPMNRAYSDLESIRNQTKLQDVMTTYCLALSDKNGTAKMKMPEIHSGLAALSDNESGDSVRVATLDSLPIHAVDFLKIDVERHEEAELRGAKQLVENSRPFIYFENSISAGSADSTEAMQMLVTLDDWGYDSYVPHWANGRLKLILCPVNARTNFPDYINIFASPREKTIRKPAF